MAITAPARLPAFKVDAATIPQGPGPGFSGVGRAQRRAETGVCAGYALAITRLSQRISPLVVAN